MSDLKIILTEDGSSSLINLELNETYHSIHGAIQESEHVFIKHGLAFFAHQKVSKEISIFEVGFGTGLNALLALKYAQENCIKIRYATIEAFPVDPLLIRELNYPEILAFENSEKYFQKIHSVEWNKEEEITSYFSITKINEAIQSAQLQSESFDVIFFDAFAPDKQPEMWKLIILQKTAMAMKPKGIFVTYSAKGQLKRDLISLGLSVEKLPGPPGKREMTRAIKP